MQDPITQVIARILDDLDKNNMTSIKKRLRDIFVSRHISLDYTILCLFIAFLSCWVEDDGIRPISLPPAAAAAAAVMIEVIQIQTSFY